MLMSHSSETQAGDRNVIYWMKLGEGFIIILGYKLRLILMLEAYTCMLQL